MDTGASGRGNAEKRETWALVLMGGGARGLAHIGVLAVLEENGLVPDIVAGTSMGAIVGGLYAAGLSAAELREIACGLNLNKYFDKSAASRRFKSPKGFFEYLMLTDQRYRMFKKVGLDKGDVVEEYIQKLTGDVRIESLPIKFVCPAADLLSGKEVLFERGKLHRALRASMSLPILFSPVRAKDMLLVDGGVLDNAPVEAAKKAGASVTVLVDVHRHLRKMTPGRLRRAPQIIQRTLDMAGAAAVEGLVGRADVVLRVPLDIDTLDFSEPEKIIQAGEEAATAGLPLLERSLGLRRGSSAREA
jgi:NTE family protein